MPDRKALLDQWLRQQCQLAGFTLEPASEDASFRRYFRVGLSHGASYIAMDAPPEKENIQPFIEIEARLQAAGVHSPRIYAQNLQQGFLLLEDLGDALYLPALNEDTVERLYADALSALLSMQACIDPAGLPDYDRKLLQDEMSLFRDWLLGEHLRLELTADEEALLQQCFHQLAESALSQPKVFVHRDYHSRNLLTGIRHAPGVIDFQDAVAGPVTYDLVSLLRDCYVSWAPSQVDEWAWGYYDLAVQSGVLRDAHEADFLRWFDLMGAQRHLKAAGIFARLHHRDAKSGYLKDIPRTLHYIVEAAARQPVLAGLSEFLQQRVLPKL